jgi:hypothetical protein
MLLVIAARAAHAIIESSRAPSHYTANSTMEWFLDTNNEMIRALGTGSTWQRHEHADAMVIRHGIRANKVRRRACVLHP